MVCRRLPHVICDVVDDKLTVCNTRSGEFYTLNETGRIVWDVCDGNAAEVIVTALHDAYPAQPREDIDEHVRELLRALEAAELVEMADDQGEAMPGSR